MKFRLPISSILLLLALVLPVRAAIPAATQARIDERIRLIAGWAADPAIVDAVRARNAALPAELAALTQDQWRALTVLDPAVRGFTRNAVGQFLKANKDEAVSEAFVSDAAGLKVGFIAKTSNWSHHGKPKHEVPMTGKTWQGPVEVDESSGQYQLQVAVPVLDGDKPIGSLVVGLSITVLMQ